MMFRSPLAGLDAGPWRFCRVVVSRERRARSEEMTMTTKRIELGDVARDTMTGFEGVVTGEHKYLHGCVRMTLQPVKLDKDGKVADGVTFDEPQLKLIKSKAHVGTNDTGGPRPEPTRVATPARR